MKKSKFIVSLMALTLLIGGAVGANANDDNKNDRSKHQQHKQERFSEAQRAEALKLMQAWQENNRPLRNSLYIKQQELKALQNADNPNVSAVSAVAKEIVGLRDQMHTEKQSLGLALDKALGLAPGTHFMNKYRFGKNGLAFEGRGHGKNGKDRKDKINRHKNRKHEKNNHARFGNG